MVIVATVLVIWPIKVTIEARKMWKQRGSLKDDNQSQGSKVEDQNANLPPGFVYDGPPGHYN